MDGRDMPHTCRAPSLSFRNPRTGQSDRLSDRVQALTSWAAEMEEKSTGITEATAEKSRLSYTHVWSYLNPRSGIYRSPVTSLQDMSEHVEAGLRRDFVGPLGDMFPNDTILRPQRHCAETWREAMSVNKSWPTQKAEDTGEFCEIGSKGMAFSPKFLVTACVHVFVSSLIYMQCRFHFVSIVSCDRVCMC